MKNFNVWFLARKPIFFALVSGFVLITLMASFSFVSAPEQNQAAADTPTATPTSSTPAGSPAFCTLPVGLNVVNRFGGKTTISENSLLYRVDGDMLNLSQIGISQNSGVNYSLFLLSFDKKTVIHPVGQFDAQGNFSFLSSTGVYAVGFSITQDLFNSCGGASTFKNVIESGGNMIVIVDTITLLVLEPTAGPKPNQEQFIPVF